MEPSRRSTLALAGISLASLAGCSSFARGGIRIGYLAVENEHPEPRDVQVLLLADGEPVFWQTVHADGVDEEANAVGGEILAGYPDEAGSYDIYAKLVGQDDWKSTDLTELDAGCCQVIVKVRSDESVEILRSAGCDDR
jgi:hypothetical protein